MKSLSSLFKLKLRGRLIATMLAVAFCSITIVSVSMLFNAKNHAELGVEQKMRESLAMRQTRLQDYLGQIRGDLSFLTQAPATAEALYGLLFNYARTTPSDLQAAYIGNNPFPTGEKHKLLRAEGGSEEEAGYHATHARVHQWMRAFLEERGYYDIFLISPEGDIIYSVFKELDYATNLMNGAYSSSGLADVWQEAVRGTPGSIAFEDFAPYAPSHGAPASFLATPIHGAAGGPDAGKLLGILAVQIPIERLGTAIDAAAVGPDMDAFVVGSDGFLRTDSVQTEGYDVLAEAFPDAPEDDTVIQGVTDLLGRASFAGTVQVNAFGVPWHIVETRTTASAFASFEQQKTLAWLSLVPIVLLASIMSWLSARSVVKPVQVLRSAVRDLVEGHRTDIPTKSRHDELGDLSRAMLQLNENAVSSYRSEAALRVSSVATMLCDKDFNIVFSNNALNGLLRTSDAYWRERIPNFSVDTLIGKNIDIFHEVPSQKRGMLGALHGKHRAEINMDSQITGITIFPIDDDMGRTGYMLQWEDLTAQRATEAAIEAAIEAASVGDFHDRVHLDSSNPFFIKLEDGLNAFFEEVEGFLQDLDTTLADFAAGNLNVQLAGNYGGQLGSIAERVHETARDLENVIAKVKHVGEAIRGSSHEISEDANNLAQRTESQGASIEETAASMEAISATVKENAENSATADARAVEATELAERGREVVAQTVAAMTAIRDSAGQISEVTSIIESLAFETHLLSLNASVEAARAGDAGKGFGVVAAEVGSLARRSTDEAKAIKKLINTSEMQVAEGDRLVGETDMALSEIIASVRTAAEMITQIADASSSQSKAIDEIAIAVAEMDNVTQQNSQLAEKSSIGASVLTEQAEQMMDSVATFVTRDVELTEGRQDAVWSSMRASDTPALRA